MISLVLFGIGGGLICAFIAYPYGFMAALLAYSVGGALCALIPGLLSRSDNRAVDHTNQHQESSEIAESLKSRQVQTETAA
jgi:hypothetical protein